MKALKKLIPAAAMLLLCAAMMTTATFAWFNMNVAVKVDTGTTNVTAPTNLQIAKFDGTEGAVGAYGATISFDSNNELNPVTVAKTGESGKEDLEWKATQKASNDGKFNGETADMVTLDLTDGKASATGEEWYKDKYFYNSYKMSLKNIGGTTVYVTLDDLAESIKVTPIDTGSTNSATLYKSVCFMVLVGESKTPAVVWSDTTGAGMQEGATLIAGSAAEGLITTLAAQADETVTVIAWMEGNNKACANNNVQSATLRYNLKFAFKAATTAPTTPEGE